MTTLNEDLIYEILSAVEEIPAGKVLSISDYYGEYPCHRVVNHVGRLAPHFTAQREGRRQKAWVDRTGRKDHQNGTENFAVP